MPTLEERYGPWICAGCNQIYSEGHECYENSALEMAGAVIARSLSVPKPPSKDALLVAELRQIAETGVLPDWTPEYVSLSDSKRSVIEFCRGAVKRMDGAE